jgi:hypothetical protein
MIEPQPFAISKTIRDRQTCFCVRFRSATTAASCVDRLCSSRL